MKPEDIEVGMCFIGGGQNHIRRILEVICGVTTTPKLKYCVYKKANNGTYRLHLENCSEYAGMFIVKYIDHMVHTFINESGALEIL